jgi:preprotein translocase subunit SecF
MHLFPKTHFDFLGKRKGFYALSALLLGGSIASLATRGVRYGIDFTGGTEAQISFDKPIELAKVRAAADKAGMHEAALQSYVGTAKPTFSIRMQSESAEKVDVQLNALKAQLPDNTMNVESKDYVGPAVGRHLFKQALLAIFLSLSGIIIYLGFRFDNLVWGVAGIIALLHDVLATYGLFSILGMEVDLLIISAILTIGGYSIHDTIVIFDRMREKLRHMHKEPLAQVMNESINETLSRTVITSGTVLLVVTILYFFGGPVIHHFALAMVFGAIVGTYSSIAVAAPLAYDWMHRNERPRDLPKPSTGGGKPRPAGRK